MREKKFEKITGEEVMELRPHYEKEIAAIIRKNVSPKVMRDEITDYHENDIAAALEEMNVTERQRLYRILDIAELSNIFEYTDEDNILGYLEEMDLKKKAAVVSEMDADKIARLLRQMDKRERETLTGLIDNEAKREIALLVSFDEDQIGSRMTTNFVSIESKLTIKQAMRELIRQAEDNDNISTLYIVDEEKKFCGALSLGGDRRLY